MKHFLLTGALLATPALAAETRCGILSNPTPQNFWLRDKDAEWTISEQGGHVAEGFDDVTDLSARGWVATNGSYGYGCACMRVEVDRQSERITRIFQQGPSPCGNAAAIARCAVIWKGDGE